MGTSASINNDNCMGQHIYCQQIHAGLFYSASGNDNEICNSICHSSAYETEVYAYYLVRRINIPSYGAFRMLDIFYS